MQKLRSQDNMEKTDIHTVTRGVEKEHAPIRKTQELYIRTDITVQGAIFHEDRRETFKFNWLKREDKVLKIIINDEKREISLFGNLLLANSLLLGQY